jgi:hypothetical protein
MTDPTCFICMEHATSTNPYIEQVCNCKGSLQLHAACYANLRNRHSTCPTCKTPYPTRDGLKIKTYIDSAGYIHYYTYIVDENIPHGSYIIRYPHGAIQTHRRYEHGAPVHIGYTWNTHGDLIERYTYLNGQLNSYYYVWGDDGQQVEVRSYSEGRLSGSHYNFDGDYVRIHMYINDRKIKYERYVPTHTLPSWVVVPRPNVSSTSDLL